MVTVFCSRLGWNNLELILAQFQSRLSFGVQRELIDLVRISVLNAQRARAFFSAGYESVASLANAEPVFLEQIIKKSAPFLRFLCSSMNFKTILFSSTRTIVQLRSMYRRIAR